MDAEINVAEGKIYQTFELSDGFRSVTIIASKEEEERIQQDQEYANERFLSALSECSSADEGDFTHNATLLLIECIRDRFEKFCSSRLERNQVYKEIQEELRSYSYNMSIDKIRNKWSNLVTTYKRIKYRPKASGVGRRVWAYYQQLEELLGPSIKSSIPAKISVSTVKPQNAGSSQQKNSVDFRVTKSEQPLGTASAVVSCPSQFQCVTSMPFSVSSQVKRKCDDTSNSLNSEKIEKREELLEQFFQQVSENETEEHNYKKRKERRDRMKLKTLQKMVSKIDSISKIQEEILRKQDSMLETIIHSKNKSAL